MTEPAPSSRRVTMRDVASAAGVSPMTVSYALRNHPRVSAATAGRIQQLAGEMGYQVDPDTSRCLARVASRGRGVRESIAFLHYGSGAREQELQHLAERRAKPRGMGVLGIWLGQEGMTVQRGMDILAARGIRGVLIGNRGVGEEHPFPDCGAFSAVELGQTHMESTLPRVLGNHYGNTRQVLAQVFQAGFQRPGLVCYTHHDRSYQGCMRAAFAVDSRADGRPFPVWMEEKWDSEGFRAWLQAEQPDVLFSCVPEAQAELGEAKRIGWVEYHDETLPREGVATLQEDRVAKINRAVDMVLGRMARGETGGGHPSTQTLIDGCWIPGHLGAGGGKKP